MVVYKVYVVIGHIIISYVMYSIVCNVYMNKVNTL